MPSTGDEKHAVAVHEAGHAVVAVLSPHADPVEKVTILPAGRALGVTSQLPEGERHPDPQSYLLASLTVSLGGRAAERLVLGEVSTGASNYLARATQLATRMVREFGMSDRLGPVGFSDESPQYLGGQPMTSRPYAEETQRVIDEEVQRLLQKAEEHADPRCCSCTSTSSSGWWSCPSNGGPSMVQRCSPRSGQPIAPSRS